MIAAWISHARRAALVWLAEARARRAQEDIAMLREHSLAIPDAIRRLAKVRDGNLQRAARLRQVAAIGDVGKNSVVRGAQLGRWRDL